MLAARRARKLRATGQPGAAEAAEAGWQQQHQRGANDILRILMRLKGFYLKVAGGVGRCSVVLPR
jgi:hypothetical protein